MAILCSFLLLGVRLFFLGRGHVIDMPNAVSFLFPNLLPIRRIAGRFFQRFRYRRGHISHMRLDRLRCLVRGHCIFTVFIAPPSGRTVAMRTYLDLTFIYNIIIYIIVFRGLQDDIRDILRDLPDTASPSLKKGLTDAHLKLSDYYYKIDASPFYLWSSRKFYI